MATINTIDFYYCLMFRFCRSIGSIFFCNFRCIVTIIDRKSLFDRSDRFISLRSKLLLLVQVLKMKILTYFVLRE
jgi:hypothetical protein